MKRTLYLSIVMAGVLAVFGCGSDKNHVSTLEPGQPTSNDSQESESSSNQPSEQASSASNIGGMIEEEAFIKRFFRGISDANISTKNVVLLSHQSNQKGLGTIHYYHLVSSEFQDSTSPWSGYGITTSTLPIEVSDDLVVNPAAISKDRASVLHIRNEDSGDIIATYVIAKVKTSLTNFGIGHFDMDESKTVLMRVEGNQFYIPGDLPSYADAGIPAEVTEVLRLADPMASGGSMSVLSLRNSKHPFVRDAFSTQKFSKGEMAVSSIAYSAIRTSPYANYELYKKENNL